MGPPLQEPVCGSRSVDMPVGRENSASYNSRPTKKATERQFTRKTCVWKAGSKSLVILILLEQKVNHLSSLEYVQAGFWTIDEPHQWGQGSDASQQLQFCAVEPSLAPSRHS